MSITTLADIIVKIRKLTGSGLNLQLSDAQIIDYINSFYLYDLPAQFRSLKLKDKYTFNTIRGIDTYPFDSEHFTTIEMPVFCAKRPIQLLTDQWSFYAINYNWQNLENFTQGNGTVGPYVGSAQSTPIIRSTYNNPMVQTKTAPTVNYINSPSQPSFQQAIPSRCQNILITCNNALGITQNVTDDGAGNLIGDGSGTINYETGAISVTFNIAVTAGQDIEIQYNPALMAIPLSILYFQNQFTLSPVPDRGYTIEMTAYRQPSQALLGTVDPNNPTLTGTAELNEWWELLAFGAAKKIYEDRVDPAGIALMKAGLDERYAVAEVRTYAQLGSQRMGTMFADQLSQNSGASGWGFPNTGI